jgi:hypothetical protein
MENEVLNFDQIKLKFPNEWVLLGNPTIEKLKVKSGIVILHNSDKRELAKNRPEWWKIFKSSTTVYTGEFPVNRRFWL